MNTTGVCWLSHNQEAPVLGGKEVLSDKIPQHGSIQVEKLTPAAEPVIWARGDAVIRHRGDVPRKKVRVVNNGKSVRFYFIYKLCLYLFCFGVFLSQIKTISHYFISSQIAPSSVFQNGTDVVYTVGSS